MRVKIHGGTADHGAPSLCLTCRWATVIRGPRLSNEIVECSQLSFTARRVTFPVVKCSDYSRSPSRVPARDGRDRVDHAERCPPQEGRLRALERTRRQGPFRSRRLASLRLVRASRSGPASSGRSALRDWCASPPVVAAAGPDTSASAVSSEPTRSAQREAGRVNTYPLHCSVQVVMQRFDQPAGSARYACAANSAAPRFPCLDCHPRKTQSARTATGLPHDADLNDGLSHPDKL